MARVVVAGSSGFLGSHLREELIRRGHEVTAFVRRPAGAGESRWNPYAGMLDPDVVEAADVVVNLAGSPTFGNPHSHRWSRRLHDSRVITTRVLAEAIAASQRRPAFLAGNAIGWYGDHGSHAVGEAADSRGHTLMTTVCRDWQDAARPAVEAGGRVTFLRTSPVIDRSSPPLQQLLPVFRAGLGTRIGDGRQRMPMISLRDWVGAVAHLVEHDVAGHVHITCPQPPTNAEFTTELARLVGRPALLAVPAPLIRLGAGRLSPELLASVDARPDALIAAGFEFRDPDIRAILTAALESSVPA
ncbi:TIGR01777 family oxidoreductase [Nocardioides sp. CER28]